MKAKEIPTQFGEFDRIDYFLLAAIVVMGLVAMMATILGVLECLAL